MLKQAQQGSVPQPKAEQAKEEVEDAMAKMEQTRVSYLRLRFRTKTGPCCFLK